MNLYNELFPEDSVVDYDEKIASESMNYFGIRFDDRVEKLAGFKDVASKGWEGLKSMGRTGLQDIKGKGTFNVRGGKPSLIGRSGNEGKVEALRAFGKGGFSGRGLAEQTVSRARGAGKLGLLASPAIAAAGVGGYAYNKKKKK